MGKINLNREWTFESEDVGEHFMNHVREQLPFYDLVVRSICKIAKNFVKKGDLVYDIGSATGNVAWSMQDLIKSRNASYRAVEKSIELCRNANIPESVQFEVINADATEYEFEDFDLGILNLTLMFIHPRDRGRLIKKLKKKLNPHGAIIVTEKFSPPEGIYSTINNRLLWSWKMESNSGEEVIQKELSLEGVQIPLLPGELEGFVEWFRFGDFASYIFINENIVG